MKNLALGLLVTVVSFGLSQGKDNKAQDNLSTNTSKSTLKSKKELRVKKTKIEDPISPKIGPRYPWALDFCGEIVYCLAFDAQEAEMLANWYADHYYTACDKIEPVFV